MESIKAQKKLNIPNSIKIMSYHSDLQTIKDIKKISIYNCQKEEQIIDTIKTFVNLHSIVFYSRIKEKESIFLLKILENNKTIKQLEIYSDMHTIKIDKDYFKNIKHLKRIKITGYIEQGYTNPLQLFLPNLQKLQSLQQLEIVSRRPPIQSLHMNFDLNLLLLKECLSLKKLNLSTLFPIKLKLIPFFQRLQSLCLNQCQVSNSAQIITQRTKNLKQFEYNSYIKTQKQLVSVLCKLPQLQKLSVAYHTVNNTDDSFQKIINQNQSKLKQLNLIGYTGNDDKFKSMVSSLTQLKEFSFSIKMYLGFTAYRTPKVIYSNLSPSIIESLGLSASNLQKLNIYFYKQGKENVNITNSIFQKITQNMQRLTSLNIKNLGYMRDVIISSGCLYLMRSKNLKYLNLDMHIDKGILLKTYRNMRRLKWLAFNHQPLIKKLNKQQRNIQILKKQ